MPRKAVEAPVDDGIDNYDLPKSIVTRMAKGALPAGVMIQKDVTVALQKGSTVFVNYLAAVAHDVATDKNHKTIAASHVLEAVKQLGWEDDQELIKHLKKELTAFRAGVEAKKVQSGKGPSKAPTGAGPGRPPKAKVADAPKPPSKDGAALKGPSVEEQANGVEENEAYREGEDEDDNGVEDEEEMEEDVEMEEEEEQDGQPGLEDDDAGEASDKD
ncbi:DNA polymerase epsilon subunit 3, partial [Phenoliferia sp. Uapishka_3]